MFEFRHDQSIFSILIFNALKEKGVWSKRKQEAATLTELIDQTHPVLGSKSLLRTGREKFEGSSLDAGASSLSEKKQKDVQQHSAGIKKTDAEVFYPLKIYSYPSRKFDDRKFYWHRRKNGSVSLYNLAKNP